MRIPTYDNELSDMHQDAEDHVKSAGLCATCRHVRLIRSDRGSVFYQCHLSATDPSFPKYPRLPVLACSGYQRNNPNHAC
jgi:hypothetical protein